MRTFYAQMIWMSFVVIAAVGCKDNDGVSPDLTWELFYEDVTSVDYGYDYGPDNIFEVEAFEAWPEDAACSPDEPHRCGSLYTVQRCQYGQWVLDTVCINGDICLNGVCVPPTPCIPGTVKGCYAFDAMARCNETGLGYTPDPCPEGTRCVLDGECRPVVCTPKYGICYDETHYMICKDDGSGYDYPQECHEGMQCIGGQCRSMCESEVKVSSYIGCEYWTVDLHNWDRKDVAMSPPAEPIPHAVVISNPGLKPVVITFETKAPGVKIDIPLAERTIPPGQMRTYTMPVMNQNGSGINNKSIRITSTHPIIAYQFNPLNNVGVFSNDGSLLLPVSALGKEYIVIALQTDYIPAMPELGMNQDDERPGYATIVAVSEGETQVTVTKAAGLIAAGPGVPEVKKGQSYTFTLKQYEVLNLEAGHYPGLSSYSYDLTGTVIQATKPIAVFGGQECAVIAQPGKSCCCCDHIEEQLVPLYAWGKDYHAIKFNPRGGTSDEDWWLIMAGEDNVEIHTTPPIPGIDGLKLNKGEFKRFFTSQSFEVHGSGPIAVAQYMLSQECTTKGNGDPALLIVPAVNQYRKDYAILVPDKYFEDWVTLIRPAGLEITLDGSPVQALFMPFGSGKYEYAYVEMQDGVHHFSAAEGFAVLAYGFDSAVSYAFAGGMNLLGNKEGGL